MDIWLPCIKFNIETIETRYSKPTELDLLFLRYIGQQVQRHGYCQLSDVLQLFSVMDSTVLHGMIHKLHMRYLQLFPDGTVELREGLESFLEDDDEEALTVQIGERTGLYPAYFDLFAGQVILDNRFVALDEARAGGAQLLPAEYSSLDYERSDLFQKQYYFALVNDYVRQRGADEARTDSYRVETLRKVPEPDLGIQYLPLKVFRAGDHFQINSQDSIPTIGLMRIAAKLDRLRSDVGGRNGKALPEQVEDAADDSAAMEEQVRVWFQRLLGTVDSAGSPAVFGLGVSADLPALMEEVFSFTTEVVMDSRYLSSAIEEAPERIYSALINFLERGGRLAVVTSQDHLDESLPGWRVSRDAKEFDSGPKRALFVAENGSAELRDIRTCRQYESQLAHEQAKRLAKKLRQGKEIQEIRYFVAKHGSRSEGLPLIWTSLGIVVPFISQGSRLVHSLCSFEDFPLAADVHWNAVAQSLRSRNVYVQREGSSFNLSRAEVVNSGEGRSLAAEPVVGRLEILSEELFDGILKALPGAQGLADSVVFMGSDKNPPDLTSVLQTAGVTVAHARAELGGADIAVISPATILARLNGYTLWLSGLSAKAVEHLKAAIVSSEGSS